MPAPIPGQVLYRFAPPTDSWTGTYSEALHGHGYPGFPYPDYWEHGSEVTDSYDFRTWTAYGVAPNGPGVPDAVAYKQVPNVGNVQRLKCTFSLNLLPQDTAYNNGYEEIAAFTFDDDGLSDWANWGYETTLVVTHEGKIGFAIGFGNVVQSTNSISAGTSYDLELYALLDPIRTVFEVWIDGSLWLSRVDSFYNDAYTQLIVGWQYNGWRGAVDAVLHVENLIWTLEGPGSTRWTMMAPGIA